MNNTTDKQQETLQKRQLLHDELVVELWLKEYENDGELAERAD